MEDRKIHITFILYKPAVPGNVGAAARALKTMGFEKLRLINPCNHLSDEALMLAHGSHDILRKAQVFPDFNSAVEGLDFLIGTTAKKRSAHEDYLVPADAIRIVEDKIENIHHIGLVFGSEESGLPNELLQRCDIASGIPLHAPYPSLNLGQAVMLYAYEFSQLIIPAQNEEDTDPISFAELKKRSAELLIRSGIPENMPLHNRILERISLLGSNDINLLHSVTARLLNKLK